MQIDISTLSEEHQRAVQVLVNSLAPAAPASRIAPPEEPWSVVVAKKAGAPTDDPEHLNEVRRWVLSEEGVWLTVFNGDVFAWLKPEDLEVIDVLRVGL